MDLVWPGLVVEENNLQVQISSLRRLLGPDAIATIPGRGYRFTAEVASTRGAGPASQQRLAAILAADVAGYSRLMAVDENATVMALDAARAVFKKRIGSSRAESSTWPAILCWRCSRPRREPFQRRSKFKTSSEGSLPAFRGKGACCFESAFTWGKSSRSLTAASMETASTWQRDFRRLQTLEASLLSDAMRWAVKGKTSVDIQDAGEHLGKEHRRAFAGVQARLARFTVDAAVGLGWRGGGREQAFGSPAAARQAVDRSSSIQQYVSRPGAGVLLRRHQRRPHHRAVPFSLPLCHLPAQLLHLQRTRGRRADRFEGVGSPLRP